MVDWTAIAIVLATFGGPIAAVQVQKWIERRTFQRDQRMGVFRSLMATRGDLLSAVHVNALNSIDFEFRGKSKELQAVRQAWRELLDHFGTGPANDVWQQRRVDLLANLLTTMGHCVGFKELDKVQIMRGFYAPVRHGTVAGEWDAIRTSLLEMLQGKRPIPIVAHQDLNPSDLSTSLEDAAAAPRLPVKK